MSDQLSRLIDIAEAARLKSGELNCLLEFINEAEIERDSEDCPTFINNRTMGTVQVAAVLMADLLSGINEDLANGLSLYAENQARIAAGRQAKGGQK